jgi:hypothetical protein
VTNPRTSLSAFLLAAAVLAAGAGDARAAGLGVAALTIDQAIVAGGADAAQAPDGRPTAAREPVSAGVAVALAIVPGFGLGHYYAYDDTPGLTFLILDAALTSVMGGTFVLHLFSVAPAYTKVALIAIPIIYGTAKVIQVVTVFEAVEAANNRTMKPAALRHLPEHRGMVAIASF